MFEFGAETAFWQVAKEGTAFWEIALSFIHSSSWWFRDTFPAGLKKEIKSMHEFRFVASRVIKLSLRALCELSESAGSMSVQ